MNFDFIIFPAPKQPRLLEQLPGNILWIPKDLYLYPKFDNFSPHLKPRINSEKLHQRQRSESPIESDNQKMSVQININQIIQKNNEAIDEIEWNQVNVSVSPEDKESLSTRINYLNQYSTQIQNKKVNSMFNIPRKDDKIYMFYLDKEQKTHIFGHIPCLYLKVKKETSKIMLFFHGNSEDITLAASLLSLIKSSLNKTKIPIIAIEYPGYSMYKNNPSDAEQVLNDAEYVYNYLVKKIGYEEQNIIVFGRSIGSGPAIYLASQKNPGCLFLMSPFTSLRSVVRDYLGSWAICILKERFDNLQNIKNVRCPTFIVHGQQDKLIPFKQSMELIKNCSGPCELILPKTMSHSSYHYYTDLIEPFIKFLNRINFSLQEKPSKKLDFPQDLFRKPK